MADLTPYAQQLQTRLDSESSTSFAEEQQYQLLRALFNVVEADLIDHLIQHSEPYTDQMREASHITDPAEQQNEIKRIRDTVLDEIAYQMIHDKTLQGVALDVLSQRTDLNINSDAGLLGEFLANSWEDSQTAPTELAAHIHYGPIPTMEMPISSSDPDEAMAGRLIESISGSHEANPIMQEVMQAFPELVHAIWQEYSHRLRQRETEIESGTETGDEMGAADEDSESKPPKIKLH